MSETTKSVRVYETRGVLAGAYKGKSTSDRLTRSHYFDVTDGMWSAPKTLCNSIQGERLCDQPGVEHADCPECVARFARRSAKGIAVFGLASDRSAE